MIVEVVIFIAGVAIISRVLYREVKNIWGAKQMFHQYGGRNFAEIFDSPEELNILIKEYANHKNKKFKDMKKAEKEDSMFQ